MILIGFCINIYLCLMKKVQHPPQNWEQTLGELDTPRINELSVGTVLKYFNQQIAKRQKTHITWSWNDVREDIKKDVNFQEPILREPIQVAQGEKPVLAFTFEQSYATGVIFSTSGSDMVARPHYALIETTGTDPKRMEVSVKFVSSIKTQTPDHFLISDGLANQLRIDAKTELKILKIYQKAEEVNLDLI